MKIIRPNLLGEFPRLLCALSTRIGGVSPLPYGMNLSFKVGDKKENVIRNRELFFDALGISEGSVAIPRQVHGNTVRRVNQPGAYPDCDALVTNREGLFLGVTVADCIPVFVYDSTSQSIAAIHAGWKGTSAGVVTAAVHALVQEFGADPHNMTVFIGPGASVCCYKVGGEVASTFDSRFVAMNDGSAYLDLKGANAHQLLEVGVPQPQIEASPYCTISDSQLFHSYRRDRDRSGRMMGVIGITPGPETRPTR